MEDNWSQREYAWSVSFRSLCKTGIILSLTGSAWFCCAVTQSRSGPASIDVQHDSLAAHHFLCSIHALNYAHVATGEKLLLRYMRRGDTAPVCDPCNFCDSVAACPSVHWLPCQAPYVIGSVLGLVGPLALYCDSVRLQAKNSCSATCGMETRRQCASPVISVTVWQPVQVSTQIRPLDTFSTVRRRLAPVNIQTCR